jgi:predicted glycogen debranching enzyme
VRTVIAGYHWFTDWGRDTMISLEGLTLCTGRYREAGYILRTFGQYVRDGLIPNMFPDGSREGLYHTADATLWFFHAVDRYLRATGDLETHACCIRHSSRSSNVTSPARFGIGSIRPTACCARAPKATSSRGWTRRWTTGSSRRGAAKAVEINALWYNALRLLDAWSRELDADPGIDVAGHADRARASFNERFWFADGGYLFDVVDGEQGDDQACRPNQVFAISLDYPVLDESRWQPVLEVVRERLLTPVGLRSLAPGHPDYKPQYYGDLRARDAAYHQGTVWGWLIGPFVDAWLKVHPEDAHGAGRLLSGFDAHLNEGCVGSISEIFDAEAPYTARGCVSQAWSVAEVLRSLQNVRLLAADRSEAPDTRRARVQEVS